MQYAITVNLVGSKVRVLGVVSDQLPSLDLHTLLCCLTFPLLLFSYVICLIHILKFMLSLE